MVWGFLLFAARAWTQLASAILLLLSARILAPTEVGIFALASALTMVLTQWVGVGSYEYVIRQRDDPNSVATAFWSNALVASGMALIGFGLAFGSGFVFHSSTLPWVVAALAPLTLPAGCRSAMEALMVREGQLRRLAACTLLVEAVALAAGVTALLSGLGLWSLVVHKWTSIMSEAVTYMIAARWRIKLSWNADTARAMFHFGHGILGDRFLNYFQTYGIDFILGAFLNPAAVAVYRVGARLVTSVTTVVTEPMRQINWKHLTDAVHEGRPVAPVAEGRIVWMASILWGPLLGLAMVADLLVTVILGNRWLACVWIVRLSAAGVILGTISLLTEATLGALDRTRWLPAFRLVSLATLFSALAFLVHYGPIGAAASQVVASCLLLGFNLLMQWRIAGIRVVRYGMRLIGVALAAAAMAAAVVETRMQIGSGLKPAATLAVCVVMGGITYGAALAFIHRRTVGEVVQRLRDRLSPASPAPRAL
jgi:O-antigen/teichoic acid export membrane protein